MTRGASAAWQHGCQASPHRPDWTAQYLVTVRPRGDEHRSRDQGLAGRAAAGSDDVIDLGGHLRLWPWRSARGTAAGMALAALVVGLLLGFGAGRVTAGQKARPTSTPRPSATAAPLIGTGGIVFTGNRCAVQRGRALQLGIEVANQSGSAVSVLRIDSVLPGHGLRQIGSAVATCGSVPVPGGVPVTSIVPGATAWLTGTFAVEVKCPAPLPVLFVVEYASSATRSSQYYQGFPDLASVPYTGCRG
jgi:hypothetical protein